MLPRLALSPRLQRWLSGAAAGAVCVVGSYLFAKTVDAHYAVREWLIWRLLLIWGYALLFNVSCVALGSALLRRLLGERELPALERLLFSMMLGFVAFVLTLYGLGFVGQLKVGAALAVPAAFLIFGHAEGRRLLEELVAWRTGIAPPSRFERVFGSLAAIGGAAALVFLYLEALDVSAINFDASWYHFPIAQDYARLGRIVPLPGDGHKAFPHLTSLVHTWALLVPGLKPLPLHWMLSLHLEYTIVLWRLVACMTLTRWLLGGRDVRGLWAGFFLFPSVFIYDQSIGGAADHFVGFFAVPLLLSCARALRGFEVRWSVLFGVALGGHLLVKYQAIYLLFAVTVAALIRLLIFGVQWLMQRAHLTPPATSPSWRAIARGCGAALLTVVLISAPHFTKNAVFYKNPVYPYAQGVFTHSWPKRQPGYYQESSTPERGVFSPRGEGLQRQSWVLAKLLNYSFTTANRSLTSKRPYMGALFSLLLPCALFVPGRRRTLFTVGAIALAFMVWGNTAANDRYLLAFYDLCIGTALALLVRVWDLGPLARAGAVPLLALQLFWGGDAMLYYGRKELNAALTLIAAGYDGSNDGTRFSDQSSQRQITDATPKSAVILARNYKGLLGLDRMVLSDIQNIQYFVDYSFLKDPRELYDQLQQRGVTHLLYPAGTRRPDALNNLVLFGELFRAGANSKRFGKLRLTQLSPQPPAPSAPYLVAVSGIREYPDGIYRVEQLDVSFRAPNVRPKPKPMRRLPGRDATLSADVSAVVIGRGGARNFSADTLGDFESQEKFADCEYYLRRN